MNLDFQWLFKVEETSQKSLLSHLQYIPCVSLNWSGSLAYFWTNYCMSAENVGIILSLLYGSFFLNCSQLWLSFIGFSTLALVSVADSNSVPRFFSQKNQFYLCIFPLIYRLWNIWHKQGIFLAIVISVKLLSLCFFLIELSKFSSWFVEILYSRYTSFCWIYVLQKVLSFHI